MAYALFMNRTEQAQTIINIAEKYLGIPYAYGAYRNTKPEEEPKGFDCSFFTHHVFTQAIGKALPLSSLEQAAEAYKRGAEVTDLDAAQTGDLLFFRGSRGHYNDDLFDGREILIGHVGIYIKETAEIIHAQSAKGVVREKLADAQIRVPNAYRITFIGNYF